MSLSTTLRYKTRQTNYPKRLELLKSKRPRLVYRKTNTRLIAGLYETPDVSRPDKCLALFDSRIRGQKTCKNKESLRRLVQKICTFLKAINCTNFIIDLKNKRQGLAFVTQLHQRLAPEKQTSD